MKNKIEDLRNHLFATLEGLRDEEKPMDLDRAREIANVARVIVDSAKAEVSFMQVAGAVRGTGFIPVVGEKTTPIGRRLPAGDPPAAPSETPLRRCEKCSAATQADPCEHCGTPWKRVA